MYQRLVWSSHNLTLGPLIELAWDGVLYADGSRVETRDIVNGAHVGDLFVAAHQPGLFGSLIGQAVCCGQHLRHILFGGDDWWEIAPPRELPAECKRKMETTMSNAEQHLGYWTKTPASDAGKRVAELLDRWQGLHNFDQAAMKRVDWSNTRYIELRVSHLHSAGQLSTFDFSGLTTLVLLAHDHCIRVDIRPCTANDLRLVFHPRHQRSGELSSRHPTIEQALSDWRKTHDVFFNEPAAAEVSL